MNASDARAAISRAEFNKRHSGLIFVEILILAGYLGTVYSSWWIFGAFFIAFIVLLRSALARFALNIVFSAFWGYVVFLLLNRFFSVSGLAVVGAVIAFMISAGSHSAGNQWVADIAGKNQGGGC